MKCVHFKLGQIYWSQEVLHNKNWSHNICVICRTSTHNCIVFPNHRIALLCFFPVYIIIHLVSFNYMMTAWLSCCVLSRLLVIGLEGGANWESYMSSSVFMTPKSRFAIIFVYFTIDLQGGKCQRLISQNTKRSVRTAPNRWGSESAWLYHTVRIPCFWSSALQCNKKNSDNGSGSQQEKDEVGGQVNKKIHYPIQN